MTFTVITPATNKKLATLENLKLDLQITGNGDDPYLERLIDRASAAVCTYLGVPAAQDGSATVALETIEETFRETPWLRSRRSTLILARKPVPEIVSVLVAGVAIDASDYELDGNAAILTRTYDANPASFTWSPGSRTVIRYKAGWTVAPAANPTLPPTIEGAVIGLIKAARAGRTRDPMVKSEWVLDIERIDYWVGQIGSGGNTGDASFPPDVASMLDPYRYEPVVG